MPIPLETNPEYTQNILRVYRSATPDQVAKGRTWYRVANDLAMMLGDNVNQGAGLLAVLSARTSWKRTVSLATHATETGDPKGHTNAVLDKVRRILAGQNPEDLLPMDLKTGHFYRCIMNPNDPEAVVIDRHAHDVAVGQRWTDKANRGLSSVRRYTILADAYRDAAKRLGILPQELQAITWTVQTDTYAAGYK